jgi:hypothetical protein
VTFQVNSPNNSINSDNNGNTYWTVSGTGLSESGYLTPGGGEVFEYTTSSTLSYGSSHTYTLVVTNNRGSNTATSSATTKIVEPPTNLTVSAITSNSALVSWTSSITAGATYQVTATGGTVNYSSGTSATITGLTSNTSYTVTVRALDSGYQSEPASQSFTTLVQKTITATISATSSLDGTEATVQWLATKSVGVTFSFVEAYGPGIESGGTVSGTVIIPGLSPGGTYTWYVDALGFYEAEQLSDSDFVALVMNQPVSGAPSAPQDFTAVAVNTGTVSLTWNGSTSAGGFPPVTYYLAGPGTINTPITTNNYATATGLSPGTTYTFSIYAQNTNPSAPNTSATVYASAVTPNTNLGIAALVANITASSNAAGTEATVSWSTISYGISVYYPEADVSGDGLSFSSNALSGSQVVTGLTPGSSYIFRIYVIGFTRAGILVAASDVYVVTMSNPTPPPPPAVIADKIYYHNGTTYVQANAVQVYNGTWVASSLKTSDGQGNWT